MTPRDVHPNEMNEPHDFNDNTTEALLCGRARDADPQLADLLGDIRAAYASKPPAIGTQLLALMSATATAQTKSSFARRLEQIRASLVAKVGVGAAAFVVATGGLAAAGVLPAPVKDAVSHLGFTTPSHHNSHSPSQTNATTTTNANPADTSPSGEARNPTSDGACPATDTASVSADNQSCATTKPIADGAVPATTDRGGDNTNETPTTTIETDTTPNADNTDATPTTTNEPDATPNADNTAAAPTSGLDGGTTTSNPSGDN